MLSKLYHREGKMMNLNDECKFGIALIVMGAIVNVFHLGLAINFAAGATIIGGVSLFSFGMGLCTKRDSCKKGSFCWE